jgi:hypothetical protein
VLTYLDQESNFAAGRGSFVRANATAEGPGAQAAPAASGQAPPASGPLPERAFAPSRAALAAYESMRAQLAADDFAGAKSHATALAEGAMNAAADGGAAQKALLELATSARAVGAAADIDAARLSFGELSKRVVALLVGEPKLREGRHLFLCPMASGYKKWVQTAPALNNPYWGKRMLTCGNQLAEWAILELGYHDRSISTKVISEPRPAPAPARNHLLRPHRPPGSVAPPADRRKSAGATGADHAP